MQSDDNQPRQDDESSLVEHVNGSYISVCVCVFVCVWYPEVIATMQR